MISERNVVWIDLEMTGLNPEEHQILQIAAIVTDNDLTVRAEGPEIVIHQPAEHMQKMDDMVRDMHTSSGLLNKVYESNISVEYAEQEMIAFIKTYCIPGTTMLCGNSIWVDRIFLKRYMPALERLFYYRMIDVSTIKELVSRWYPHKPKFEKKKQHTALADIYESIAELRYYREHYFLKNVI
jgi:oligoribonuclease